MNLTNISIKNANKMNQPTNIESTILWTLANGPIDSDEAKIDRSEMFSKLKKWRDNHDKSK